MFAPFPLEFYLNYKVSTEIQGLSSTDRNFKDFQVRFLRTFKVYANPGISFSLAYRSGVSCFAFYRPAKGGEKRPGSVSYFPHAFPRPACLALYARFVLRSLEKREK